MGFHYKTGEDFSTGSDWCKVPGTYHVIVEHVEDEPTRKGQPWPEAAFRVYFKILAGTAEGQVDKKIDETFFHPKPTAKDGGKMALKKIDRMLLSTGLLSPEQAGQEVDLDLTDMVGRQVVVEFESDGKYMSIAYANIYHVDDPEVSGVPKNEKMLGMIPTSARRIGAQPKPKSKPDNNVNLGEI